MWIMWNSIWCWNVLWWSRIDMTFLMKWFRTVNGLPLFSFCFEGIYMTNQVSVCLFIDWFSLMDNDYYVEYLRIETILWLYCWFMRTCSKTPSCWFNVTLFIWRWFWIIFTEHHTLILLCWSDKVLELFINSEFVNWSNKVG